MGFSDRLANFLKLPTTKDIVELKEQLKTQQALLESTTPKTFASQSAREQKEVDDYLGLVSKRTSVQSLQQLYLFNQFVFRGVNVRAEELITRGYEVVGEDEKGVDFCFDLIENSGSTGLFKRLSINTDVCGNGYLEKVSDANGKLVYLRHVNPLNFGFLTDDTTNKIILDDRREPKAYMQITYADNGEELKTEIPKEKIAHLKFNEIGDEFNGVSTLQPVYNTAIRLMNMEQAAAESAVKSANPIIVGKTTTKSPQDLSRWASILQNISGLEQVFLPDGVSLEMLAPGRQNFSAYSEYFLAAVIAATGVPKAILTGNADASSGNRGTVSIQSRHFYSVIRSNQRTVEVLFNKIFEECAMKEGFKAPKLVFKDIAEDAAIAGQQAMDLYGSGLMTLEEARITIGLETTKEIKDELMKQNESKLKYKANSTDPEVKEDIKVWHDDNPQGPGTQKGEKKAKRYDPEVPSAKE